eukprot:2715570-Pleurochrysis_carterae.AAC.1
MPTTMLAAKKPKNSPSPACAQTMHGKASPTPPKKAKLKRPAQAIASVDPKLRLPAASFAVKCSTPAKRSKTLGGKSMNFASCRASTRASVISNPPSRHVHSGTKARGQQRQEQDSEEEGESVNFAR